MNPIQSAASIHVSEEPEKGVKRYFGPDPDKGRLRATVDTIGKEIERIPGHARVLGQQPSLLLSTYDDLVKLLVLGAEPLTKVCPSCGTYGMRAATICGNCWTALTTPA